MEKDIDNPQKQKELVWVQILYLYIIPVLLLYFNIFNWDLVNARFIVLLVVSLLLLGIVKHAKWTLKDLGIIKDYLKDIIPYTIFTVASVGFLFWLSLISENNPMYSWWTNYKFLLLFIPISVLQEVALRGILMNMLFRAFKNPFFIILINSAIFALIHIIYLNAIFVIPFTFMAGIGFAWIYYRYPNLILISISHSILNFVAMILGFFVVR
jgi:uncharacterized protein